MYTRNGFWCSECLSCNYNMGNSSFWQASFDEFFGLLTKYCMNKYHSIMQSMLVQGTSNVDYVGLDAAKANSREMPVELLRASLPLTLMSARGSYYWILLNTPFLWLDLTAILRG
ncbi:unnamed protein product [Sphenostylis stenocarpa]|uniref:Uncharacterized protein n=1 Tax=Sphenostylis stenocarpa TaxID=92480 RepID=A0AA86SGT1_9FABA|nr:unnamed protein product [Sphenostylis stenocarpa]